MTKRHKCPQCNYSKTYVIRRQKRRCLRCKYEWQPDRLPLRLKESQWHSLLMTFFKSLPSHDIAQETGLERKRVMRALLMVRRVMANDIPAVFSGTVEIDETYLGGQWKNKRRSQKIGLAKRGRGTKKTPVFGILCRKGKVWAEIVPDVEAKTLIPLIKQRVKPGSTVCSDTWKSYTGIAAKGYVHRLVEHGKGEYSDKKGSHINGLEGFWGCLKRRLAAKGGIRKERLPLYLAEYVWRYNHRNMTVDEKTNKMISLLRSMILSKNLVA
ncbi:MAG: IS1595 family transposase [Thermodesulfovibrionales bacterium]|nr:IS1595 family transposase [Thermodesulfovibrionales bacterium]